MSSSHIGVAHQFENFDQQRESSTLGMWLFVAQEVMFFGGLFAAYLVYRLQNPDAFAHASNELDVLLGGINTAVLIASSFTMAMGVHEARMARGKRCAAYLSGTIVLGCAFLVIKYFEYSAKFEHHLIPGHGFQFPMPELAQGAEIFFSLYFMMTGLHALHMIIGVVVVGLLIPRALRNTFNMDYHNPVECTGLYWHFVDIVWIFLFPLLYLLGFHLGGH